MSESKHLVLFDSARGTLADRLRMQGYVVTVVDDPAEGARVALEDPPAAVIADLWMPSISGVQLCRLLRAEAATESVPVVLRGPEGARNRFWAERAGAAAYVVTGRMGDLVRALTQAIAASPPSGGFFTALTGRDEVRERIAAHLDAALFESVLASEVRALSTLGAFDRLFDLFSQFASRVIPYRWLAVATTFPPQLGLHANPSTADEALFEARQALSVPDSLVVTSVADDDAYADASGPDAIVRPIQLGNLHIGALALAPREGHDALDQRFVEIITRELAGPIRMAMLVEESQRLATVDALTGLLNRRAFSTALELELARCARHHHPLSVILLDVDHFKAINDNHGHHAGDRVLAALGHLLAEEARRTDLVARWGGEEFVLALTDTPVAGGRVFCDRLRASIEALDLRTDDGERIPVTASIGLTTFRPPETLATVIDRADRAMYAAKVSGRNRVEVAAEEAPVLRVVSAPERP